MTLKLLFDAPITLADLHYFTPIDFVKWGQKLDMNLTWKTIEHSWGNGDKLIIDLKQRASEYYIPIESNLWNEKFGMASKEMRPYFFPIKQIFIFKI